MRFAALHLDVLPGPNWWISADTLGTDFTHVGERLTDPFLAWSSDRESVGVTAKQRENKGISRVRGQCVDRIGDAC